MFPPFLHLPGSDQKEWKASIDIFTSYNKRIPYPNAQIPALPEPEPKREPRPDVGPKPLAEDGPEPVQDLPEVGYLPEVVKLPDMGNLPEVVKLPDMGNRPEVG